MANVHIDHANIRGKIPFFASPGGEEPFCRMNLEFKVSYQDYLLLTGSEDEGYAITITPLKQPLVADDQDPWQLPES